MDDDGDGGALGIDVIGATETSAGGYGVRRACTIDGAVGGIGVCKSFLRASFVDAAERCGSGSRNATRAVRKREVANVVREVLGKMNSELRGWRRQDESSCGDFFCVC